MYSFNETLENVLHKQNNDLNNFNNKFLVLFVGVS